MTIPRIHVKEVDIPNIYLPDWMSRQPNVDHLVPPVVLNIGNPIVDIPGCVKMHKDDKRHKNNIPIDKKMVENDPKKAMTVCPDGSYPAYDAMNYEPEQLTIVREAPVPDVPPPPDTPQPDVTPPEIPPKEEETECPAPNQPRVGDLTQNGEERVIGHELSADGKTCVVLYEDTTAVEKFLPSTNQVSVTAAIAVVATASAAATPLLLRVFKPVITKLWKTIQKKLGKKPYRPSRDEIKANQYRQSKGLSPLNFEKMKKKG